MNRTSRALSRFVDRQIRDAAEVSYGVYQMPHGLRRGVVRLGGCEQDVTAQRISDHAKGERVAVVGGTILPTPPARPGPASRSTLLVSGTPYAAPPQLALQSGARAIIVDLGTDEIHLVRWEGGVAVEIEASRAGLGGEMLGLGDGSAATRMFSDATADKIVQVRTDTLATHSEYSWIRPSPNPNLAAYAISEPTEYDGSLYWVELEADPADTVHTWELMSAPTGSLSSAVAVSSVEVDNSVIDTGSLIDMHIWPGGGTVRPFRIPSSGWRFEPALRYGKEPFTAFFEKDVTVDFGAGTAVLGHVAGSVILTDRPLRDGNLGCLNVISDSLPDPYAARITSTSKAFTLVWPRPGVGKFASTHDQFGNVYNCTVKTFSTASTGAFEVVRGDITDASPTLEAISFGEPNTLIGASTSPLLGWFID